MNLSIRHLLAFFLQFGLFGLFLVAIADDSFLFLPIGSDLLAVILIARHHERLPFSVLAAASGSTIGVFFLDLVCRKIGENGLKRLVKPRLLDYLKAQMQNHAAVALVISCLAPPPFPFGASIATAGAFQYPRMHLLVLVFVARAFRYSLVGWAAIYFGRHILRIANSAEFMWSYGRFHNLLLDWKHRVDHSLGPRRTFVLEMPLMFAFGQPMACAVLGTLGSFFESGDNRAGGPSAAIHSAGLQ